MSGDCMRFPDTVEEFMDQYKVVDKEGIYMSKGAKLVPIFRMEQWFEHEKAQLSQEGTTKDAISRQEALDAFGLSEKTRKYGGDHSGYNTMMLYEIQGILEGLPSAQPEQPTEVQDILQYLDEYLHPIVSPEHWSVYSELYDMVSMLQSSQPEQRWIPCSERLPEAKQRVLVTFPDGTVDIKICIDAGYLKWFFAHMVAWMPLPEPYAERRTDG